MSMYLHDKTGGQEWDQWRIRVAVRSWTIQEGNNRSTYKETFSPGFILNKKYEFLDVSDPWWAQHPKGRIYFVIKTLVNVPKLCNHNDIQPIWQAFITILTVEYKILLGRLIDIIVLTFLVIMNHCIPNASSLILTWYRSPKHIFLSHVSMSISVLSQQMLESTRFLMSACSFRPKILHVGIVLFSLM